MKKVSYEQDIDSPLEWFNYLAYKHRIQISKIITMLLLIKEEGPVGRYFISKEFILPEGTIRGILSTLRKKGVVHASKEGCNITERGENFLSKILQILRIKDIKSVDFDFLAMDKFCAVAHVLQGRRSLFEATILRDKAIRAGASGAIILTYEKGKLMIPRVCEDLAALNPFLAKCLKNEFSLVDDDLLISAFAPSIWKAKEATLFAIL